MQTVTAFFRARRQSPPRGLSLVELMIVLALSSMIVAGSLAWFGSKRSTDFYDQMRQIESSIREVQSEISSNLVPGYADAAGCTDYPDPSPSCPLSDGDQVLATGVGIGTDLTQSAVTRTLQVRYFKGLAADGHTITDVRSYGEGRQVALPVGIHLAFIKSFPKSLTGTCDVDGELSNSTTEVGPTVFTTGAPSTVAHWSMITFRRSPSILNSFGGNGVQLLAGVDVNIDPAVYADWGADNPVNTIPNTPCATMWGFESDERVTVAGVAQARFKGEIVFNLASQTMRLQTH